ncbi:excinuclease ABC subunit A [Candidatus Desulfofervidus auxilii]|uniref:UvrABC system protein A n=1 Tax=Desulfofervidus auxilii TaxID=1621989 RepID=A0A7U4TIM7_DESA2|nr:ATP-binding cassette domain-containing protein [Candidatus Desulfofervidus auxilii]AMM41478.1 excinuclease ABC subunit A [Candidatus Desulfofervidus auxilii]
MSELIIEGAAEHNLKGFDITIPKQKIIAITGVSGSGKSSLALDIIYKEGQRRYLSTLLPGGNRLLPRFEKAKVREITGLSPTLGLKQHPTPFNSRSTIGTLTGIYGLLRVLYAKIGIPHCPSCNFPLLTWTVPEIVKEILNLPKGEKLTFLVPIFPKKKKQWWKRYLKEGFTKIRIDGCVYDMTEERFPDKGQRIEIMVDRIIVKEGIKGRIRDSVELAFRLGNILTIERPDKKTLFFTLAPICPQCGFFFPQISPAFFSFNSPLGACPACKGLGKKGEKICPVCEGKRLKTEALAVKIGGKDIFSVSNLPLEDLMIFLRGLNLSSRQRRIASPILEEMEKRITQLLNIGLNYLSLSRSITQVSSGEYQRLILSLYVINTLSDVIFVLDEPTTGLHPKEVKRLISTLRLLKALGNTIIVIEHDLEVILNADYVIELGPGAGEKGGEIVFVGNSEALKKSPTLTGQYLSGRKKLSRKKHLQKKDYLVIEGAAAHNLKNITVSIPLNCLTCICGVSGSGKTSLIINVLYQGLKQKLQGKGVNFTIDIKGIEKIKKVVSIDAHPIGKTPKSNPATYTGVFTHIRQLFAQIPEARARGYTAERFSLNVKGGRCEVCKGEGVVKIEMGILPNVFIPCDACQGKRFNPDTLEIIFKGKNIAQVLDMSVIEAYEFFRHIPSIKKYLYTMIEVGLGYLKLGQPAPSLSGGEAQRLKLARELIPGTQRETIYILDEPSIGLHLEDINHLLSLLDKLIEKGNTVIIAEHHPEIIKAADYLIELGPEGGGKGGYLINSGWI